MSYPDPRYLGDPGEVSATLRRADAPAELRTATGLVHYLATGASTNGQFGLYRWEMGPTPSGPGPHFHRTMSESFFV
ncbi:MAG: cupin, partial [Nocardioidaceae bacterium]